MRSFFHKSALCDQLELELQAMLQAMLQTVIRMGAPIQVIQVTRDAQHHSLASIRNFVPVSRIMLEGSCGPYLA